MLRCVPACLQTAQASAALGAAAALTVLVRAPSCVASWAEDCMGLTLRQRASWSRRRRKSRGYRAGRRPAFAVTRACSEAQKARDASVSCCSSTMVSGGQQRPRFLSRLRRRSGRRYRHVCVRIRQPWCLVARAPKQAPPNTWDACQQRAVTSALSSMGT